MFFAGNCRAETLTLKSENEKQEVLNPNEPTKLTLHEAINIAMKNNHHVQSAIATLPITESNLTIAKYRPNPSVGTFLETTKGGAFHPADITTPLELGKKRYWRIRVAKEQISKTELEIAKVLWDIHNQVHISYSDLAIGLELYDLAKKRVGFYSKLLEVADDRFSLGEASKLDVVRAKMELKKTEKDLNDIESRLAKSKIDFNHSIGYEPESEITLEEVKELKPKIKLNEYTKLKSVIDDALNKRLELAILEKDFGITRAQLKKSQWERIPNLSVSTGAVSTSNQWGLDVDVIAELPVFNRKQGEIQQAKAKIEYLEKEKERIKHDVRVEVATALKNILIREKQLEKFEDNLLAESKDVLDMIEYGYKEGELSLTDVLNAEQQKRQIEEGYLGSLLNYQIALASLEYSVGIPLDDLTGE